MKLFLALLFLFLTFHCLAREYNPKYDLAPRAGKQRPNESKASFHDRMIDSGVYTLPGDGCIYPDEDYFSESRCIQEEDSCCFKKLGWICMGQVTNPMRAGRCKRFKAEDEDEYYKLTNFFNTTE
ncbi:hypothetical protein HDE_05072 [Halotydeus destructor]|nr:hypothetical protein HDE_05072 [Halotydeus destructor]